MWFQVASLTAVVPPARIPVLCDAVGVLKKSRNLGVCSLKKKRFFYTLQLKHTAILRSSAHPLFFFISQTWRLQNIEAKKEEENTGRPKKFHRISGVNIFGICWHYLRFSQNVQKLFHSECFIFVASPGRAVHSQTERVLNLGICSHTVTRVCCVTRHSLCVFWSHVKFTHNKLKIFITSTAQFNWARLSNFLDNYSFDEVKWAQSWTSNWRLVSQLIGQSIHN